MWICSQLGFYSIVEKAPHTWHIRGRSEMDMLNLVRACDLDEARIICTQDADYRWRIVVEKPVEFAKIFLSLAGSVDYPNFKTRVHELDDQVEKLPAYTALWAAMHRLQNK